MAGNGRAHRMLLAVWMLAGAGRSARGEVPAFGARGACYPLNVALRTHGSEASRMRWILSNIRWIMIVSGALTTTMIYAAIAPEAALQSTFGESLHGPVADIVVRNWGALIAL